MDGEPTAEVEARSDVLLETVARVLPLVAGLLVVSSAVQVFAFDGFAAGDRIYTAAANMTAPFTAFLALAGIVLLAARPRLVDRDAGRLAVAAASAVAIVTLAAAVVTIWRVVTFDPGSSITGASSSIVGDGSWPLRVNVLLRAFAVIAITGLTLLVAMRLRATDEPVVTDEAGAGAS
jgi:hypothetical protein